MKTTECPNKSLSLDEAIAHADEVAGDCGTACKREHKQLADWLRELKSRRSAECGDVAKLCEALVEARKVIKSMGGYWATETLPIIDAALASPQRNCERFQTKDAAREAFQILRGHRVWADVSLWDDRDEIEAFLDWLFAIGQEGGNRADK